MLSTMAYCFMYLENSNDEQTKNDHFFHVENPVPSSVDTVLNTVCLLDGGWCGGRQRGRGKMRDAGRWHLHALPVTLISL